jgi:hypothetical protein
MEIGVSPDLYPDVPAYACPLTPVCYSGAVLVKYAVAEAVVGLVQVIV